MSLEQYALLGEIVASLAVFASLIYLAIQMRQNTEAIHAQSRQAIKEGVLTEITLIMSEPDLYLSLTEKEELLPIEQGKLNAYFIASLRAREFSWLQYQNGVIDESQWETENLVSQVFVDSKRFREWWSKVGEPTFSKSFVIYIEGLIKKGPATDTYWSSSLRWASNRKN